MLRALAIIYIVGFWHVQDYTVYLSYSNPITRLLTLCVLGLFVYLSGFLLSIRYSFNTISSVRSFYIRRFLRIYPMYIVTAIGFFVANATNKYQLVKGLVFLNVLTGSSPRTIWFVEMIFLFYLISPFLLFPCNSRYVLLTCISIYIPLIFLIHATKLAIDQRIGLLLIMFIIGIMSGKKNYFNKAWHSNIMVICSGIFFPIVLMLSTKTSNQATILTTQIAIILFLPLALGLNKQLLKKINMRFIHAISYASFAMYLLHRFVMKMAQHAFEPRSVTSAIFYYVFLCVPLTFCISYALQRWYDDM